MLAVEVEVELAVEPEVELEVEQAFNNIVDTIRTRQVL